MRILMLIAELGYGGAEGSFLRLARQLANSHSVRIAVFKEQYDNIHYTGSATPADLIVERLDSQDAQGRLRRWRRRAMGLKRLREEFRPHATISFLTGPNLLNVLAGGPGKRIVSIRGSRRYDAHSGSRMNSIYEKLVDPIVWSRADAIVAVSKGLAGEIARNAPHAGGKIEVISGYVDSERLTAAATEPVEPVFERLSGTQLIVAAGRLSPEKGFSHLLRVFVEVKRRVPGARLLIIGDGPSKAELGREATQLGLSMTIGSDSVDGDVILPGFRPDPHRYFRLAKVFVLCSASEGFPNIVIEALASGIRVVAGDVPWGGREILGLPADVGGRPYPTKEPFEAPLGTLMPRIDDPAGQAHWIEVLSTLVANEPLGAASAEDARKRVRSLDSSHAARRWSLLIRRLSQ